MAAVLRTMPAAFLLADKLKKAMNTGSKERVSKVESAIIKSLDELEDSANSKEEVLGEADVASWKCRIAEVKKSVADLTSEYRTARDTKHEALQELRQCLMELHELKRQRLDQFKKKGDPSRSDTRPRLPPWVPDSQQSACKSCEVNFTVFRRKHHCRNCGDIFCVKCACTFQPVPKWGYQCPVRVCKGCATATDETENDTAAGNQTSASSAPAKPSSFLQSVMSPTSRARLKKTNLNARKKEAAPRRPAPPSFLSAIASPDARARLKKTPSAPPQREAESIFSPTRGGGGSSLLNDLRNSMKKRRRDIEGERLAEKIEESISSSRKAKRQCGKMSRVNSITPQWGSIAKLMNEEEAAEEEKGDGSEADKEFAV